jgi:uncharacterized DUF497 family protein
MKVEFDEAKNQANIAKHGLSFRDAKRAFSDKQVIILDDKLHSTDEEPRYICIGKVDSKIATVVFTARNSKIRIISAGFYRKQRRFYEERNK